MARVCSTLQCVLLQSPLHALLHILIELILTMTLLSIYIKPLSMKSETTCYMMDMMLQDMSISLKKSSACMMFLSRLELSDSLLTLFGDGLILCCSGSPFSQTDI